MKTITKVCVGCRKSFEASLKEHRRGNANFCSRSCVASHTGRARAALNTPNCVCAQCGQEFYRNASKQSISKSGLQFCSRICKDVAQRIGGLAAIQPSHYGDNTSEYRVLALRELPNECARCGYDEHLAALIVHHKDTDRSNNSLENLEILCANCHAIEHWS